MELDHHGAIHLSPVHVVDALHVYQILVLSLHSHHLLVSILILSTLVIQMLVDWYVLQVVLVLLLAAEGQFRALVQLVSITFPGDVHHDEVLTQLILVRVV